MIRLNIACGANIFPGWVNIDRVDMEEAYLKHLRGHGELQMESWPEGQRKLAAALDAGQVQFEQHDLRKGFPHYADGTVDAIYLGQMIEHLNRRTEVEPFLRECLRMLKKGGQIRITTPDIIQLVEVYFSGGMSKFASEQPAFYAEGIPWPEEQLSYLLFGASGPDCTRENYEGHFHVYSRRVLYQLLNSLGFESRDYHDDRDPAWDGVVDCGMSHSLELDAVKP